jgi:hypothetical protein
MPHMPAPPIPTKCMHLMRLISGTVITNAELDIALTPLIIAGLQLTCFIVNTKNHRNHHAADYQAVSPITHEGES